MKRLTMNPLLFHQLIIHPNYNDAAPSDIQTAYMGGISDWTVMDNVPLGIGQNLIDLKQGRNILQNRDQSCETIWSKLGTSTNRKMYLNETYAAVKQCSREFYSGAMKDFREQNDMFKTMIVEWFKKAMAIDIATNAVFGDTTRAEDATGKWSWNKFDGILAKTTEYIVSGDTPAANVIAALPDGAMTAQQAHDNLKALVDAMTDEMKMEIVDNLGIYIDYEWAKMFGEYLKAVGDSTADKVGMIVNGMPIVRFDGIPVFVEKLWSPVLKTLNGGTMAHMGYLTYRGNFVFGTNKNYGSSVEENVSFEVWYDKSEKVFKIEAYFAGGTEILLPEQLIFGITNI